MAVAAARRSVFRHVAGLRAGAVASARAATGVRHLTFSGACRAEEDSHDDFKPRIKVEATDADSVRAAIDAVSHGASCTALAASTRFHPVFSAAADPLIAFQRV